MVLLQRSLSDPFCTRIIYYLQTLKAVIILSLIAVTLFYISYLLHYIYKFLEGGLYSFYGCMCVIGLTFSLFFPAKC